MKTFRVLIIEDGSPSVAFVRSAPSACRLATAIEAIRFADEMDPLYREAEPVLDDGRRRTVVRAARLLAPPRPPRRNARGEIDARCLPKSAAHRAKMSAAQRKLWAERKAAALANRTPIE